MATNYRYSRNDLEDSYGLVKLQDKITEIMVYLDGFCREHGLTYFLLSGSALGAMRHGGFIPWDDDLDIMMPYEDYMKFISACKTDLDTKRFHFQEENTEENPYFFSKIRMNGTTCIEEVNKNRKNVHQGIFVDVMCLNHAAPEGIRRDWQYGCAALLRASALAKLPEYKATGKRAFLIGFARVFVRGGVTKWLLRQVRKYNGRETEDVAHVFGRAKKKNAYYPARLFRKQRYVPFEQVQLAVCDGVEEYLTLRFGKDYMQMPSEETKAIYKPHAMIWDTEKDYTEYLKS